MAEPKRDLPTELERAKSTLATLKKERDIYYAAINACGKDCLAYCVSHVDPPEPKKAS